MTIRLPLLALALAAALTSPLPAWAQTAHGAHGDHAGHGQQSVFTIGTIEISGAFTRATLPNAPVAGGFLTLTNRGSEDDRLIAVQSPIARESQIHEMAMEDDVMKMRQLAEGILVPAGESVELAPGGLHLMFMGLTGAIAEGDAVPVVLTFEKAGSVTIELIAGSNAAAHAGH